jgi:excisionase family DNA binding protein
MTESVRPAWKPEAPWLLTIEQTAGLLNVSARTIRRLLALRQLTRRKIGNRTLIPRTSVESFAKRDHPTK